MASSFAMARVDANLPQLCKLVRVSPSQVRRLVVASGHEQPWLPRVPLIFAFLHYALTASSTVAYATAALASVVLAAA